MAKKVMFALVVLSFFGGAQALTVSDDFDDGIFPGSDWVGDTDYYTESGGTLSPTDRDDNQVIVMTQGLLSANTSFILSVDFVLSDVSLEEDWAGLICTASVDTNGDIVYDGSGLYPNGYFFRVRPENGRVTFGHNGTDAFALTGDGINPDLGILSTGVNYQAVITSDGAGNFTGQLINLDAATTLVTLSFTDTVPLFTSGYAGIYSRKMETGDVSYDNFSLEIFCEALVIIDDLDDVSCDEGQDAVFTLQALNPDTCDDTGLTYLWYRQGDTNPIASGAEYTVSDNTLTVHNVQSGDMGGYYCVVSNGTDQVSSRIATLQMRGLLAHWPLDAVDGQPDASDVTGNGYDGQLSGDPQLISGVLNEGLAFDSNDLILPGYFNLQTERTLSAWINTDAWGSWSVIEWDDPDTGEISTFRIVDGILEYGEFDRIEWYNVEYETVRLNDSQWHHVAVTCNAQKDAALYVDGKKVAEESLAESQYDPSSDITIANLSDTPELLFDAIVKLDDVRVYDYALSSNQIADLFVNANEYVCAQELQGDIDGDCQVDISDLAALGMQWLDCQRYPECVGQMP